MKRQTKNHHSFICNQISYELKIQEQNSLISIQIYGQKNRLKKWRRKINLPELQFQDKLWLFCSNRHFLYKALKYVFDKGNYEVYLDKNQDFYFKFKFLNPIGDKFYPKLTIKKENLNDDNLSLQKKVDFLAKMAEELTQQVQLLTGRLDKQETKHNKEIKQLGMQFQQLQQQILKRDQKPQKEKENDVMGLFAGEGEDCKAEEGQQDAKKIDALEQKVKQKQQKLIIGSIFDQDSEDKDSSSSISDSESSSLDSESDKEEENNMFNVNYEELKEKGKKFKKIVSKDIYNPYGN